MREAFRSFQGSTSKSKPKSNSEELPQRNLQGSRSRYYIVKKRKRKSSISKSKKRKTSHQNDSKIPSKGIAKSLESTIKKLDEIYEEQDITEEINQFLAESDFLGNPRFIDPSFFDGYRCFKLVNGHLIEDDSSKDDSDCEDDCDLADSYIIKDNELLFDKVEDEDDAKKSFKSKDDFKGDLAPGQSDAIEENYYLEDNNTSKGDDVAEDDFKDDLPTSTSDDFNYTKQSEDDARKSSQGDGDDYKDDFSSGDPDDIEESHPFTHKKKCAKGEINGISEDMIENVADNSSKGEVKDDQTTNNQNIEEQSSRKHPENNKNKATQISEEFDFVDQIKDLKELYEKAKESNIKKQDIIDCLNKRNTKLYEDLISSKDDMIKVKNELLQMKDELMTEKIRNLTKITNEPNISSNVVIKKEIKHEEDIYLTEDFTP